MNDIAVQFPFGAKAPIYAVLTSVTAVPTMTACTVAIKNPYGATMTSYAVDGASTSTASVSITLYKNVDGTATGLNFARGYGYVATITIPCIGSDGVSRTEVVNIDILVN